MNAHAQRIAIATACGYTNIRAHDVAGVYLCEPPMGTPRPYAVQVFTIPDYLNDLNAMHEAEHFRIVGNFNCYSGDTSIERAYANMVGTFSTAAQRAEAFLRTLGLWKD